MENKTKLTLKNGWLFCTVVVTTTDEAEYERLNLIDPVCDIVKENLNYDNMDDKMHVHYDGYILASSIQNVRNDSNGYSMVCTPSSDYMVRSRPEEIIDIITCAERATNGN